MTKIDLITGFLGAGKTTLIGFYVRYLQAKGLRVCILENDYGAVNVDMMLVKDLGCDIEMVAGGCDYDCHKRRFRTKLIAMGMLGYDRVIVEPSGIFDVDEFYDALQEPPLDRWYSVGNVISVVDARLPDHLSDQSEYLLASEAATAGKIILSHDGDPARVIAHLNQALAGVRCRRVITADEVITGPWESLDWPTIADCGYVLSDYQKRPIMESNEYQTLYFMNLHQPTAALQEKASAVFADPACGHVIRIKGFIPEAGRWIEMNATRHGMDLRPIAEGQEILIVIGENLSENTIRSYFTGGSEEA